MEISVPSQTCKTKAEQESADTHIKKEMKIESESESDVPTSNPLQLFLPSSSVEETVIGVPTSLALTPSCATNNLLQPQEFSTAPAYKIGSRAPLSGGKLRTKLESNIAHLPEELEIRLQKAKSKIEYQKRLHQLNLDHQKQMFQLEIEKQLKSHALRLQIERERSRVKMAFDSKVKQYQLAAQLENYKLKRHMIRLERKQMEWKPLDFVNVPIKSEAQEVCEPSPCCSAFPIKQTQEPEFETIQTNCPIKSEFEDNECLKASSIFPSSCFPIISEEAVVR
uniref:Uncharacterized protein n=1 Tax=Timema genevievae TaxID=629358 RepID=A0A7R9PME6_TIMGE|nr:unnamed protein product [Timema genevievae]